MGYWDIRVAGRITGQDNGIKALPGGGLGFGFPRISKIFLRM